MTYLLGLGHTHSSAQVQRVSCQAWLASCLARAHWPDAGHTGSPRQVRVASCTLCSTLQQADTLRARAGGPCAPAACLSAGLQPTSATMRHEVRAKDCSCLLQKTAHSTREREREGERERGPSQPENRAHRLHLPAAPAGQVLQMDKQPFLLRQIESRKKAESDARRKTSDQEKAKAVAKAAKRPGGSLDAPEPKRSAAEDSGERARASCCWTSGLRR